MGRLVVMLLASAAWLSGPVESPAQSRSEPIPTVMTVWEGNSACALSLKPGDSLMVQLESNPSTGYGWAENHTGDDVLKLEKMEHRKGLGGTLGAAGWDVWTFTVISTGKQRLSFQYRRPWEKSVPAAKTVWYSIVVQKP